MMRQSKSKILKLLILILGVVVIPAFTVVEQHTTSSSIVRKNASDDLKHAAFQVLQTKCNVCHEKKNPRRVFTKDNMSALAPKIYKQVFIKRRMPKGKTIRLTNEEYNTLERWLFTQNIF